MSRLGELRQLQASTEGQAAQICRERCTCQLEGFRSIGERWVMNCIPFSTPRHAKQHGTACRWTNYCVHKLNDFRPSAYKEWVQGHACVLRLDARRTVGVCAGTAQVISLAISLGMSLWSLHYIMAKMDPDRPAREASKIQKQNLELRLGRRYAPTPHILLRASFPSLPVNACL